MKGLCIAALFLAVVLAGCSRRAEPLDFPEPEAVKGIEVTLWKGAFWQRHEISGEYTITDRRRIEEILALLKKNNQSYRRRPFSGPWSHQYTITVWGKPSLYLHLGKRWFGGCAREGWPAENRERRMSASERERLLALIARGD